MSIVSAISRGICSLLLVSDCSVTFELFLPGSIDSPVEIIIGTLLLYNLLGVSCFIGLAAICLFLPLNHYGGKVIVNAQENLMKTRDERVALMNEVCCGPHWYRLDASLMSFSIDFGCHPYAQGVLLYIPRSYAGTLMDSGLVHGMGTEFREKSSRGQKQGTQVSETELSGRSPF